MVYRRRDINRTCTHLVLALFFCVPVAAMGVNLFVKCVRFEQDVSGRLKRAADANSIKLAKQELAAAAEGMRQRGLFAGRSHVMWYTPKCDVKFWHDNIKSALRELEIFPEDADSLTVSNQLMKLRETLLDEGGKGVSVTLPPNIVVFADQGLWAFGWVLSGLAVIVGVGFLVAALRTFD